MKTITTKTAITNLCGGCASTNMSPEGAQVAKTTNTKCQEKKKSTCVTWPRTPTVQKHQQKENQQQEVYIPA